MWLFLGLLYDEIYVSIWYFPYDQCMMLQNCSWVKDPFKGQGRTMDLNVHKIHGSSMI